MLLVGTTQLPRVVNWWCHLQELSFQDLVCSCLTGCLLVLHKYTRASPSCSCMYTPLAAGEGAFCATASGCWLSFWYAVRVSSSSTPNQAADVVGHWHWVSLVVSRIAEAEAVRL
jgi:hypothetical protein